MNKLEFLQQLAARLGSLPEQERERALNFYSEMIDDRIEDGMSEAEAVAAVGTPEEIAHEVLLEQPLPRLMQAKLHKNAAPLRVWQIVLIVLGSPVWLPLLASFFVVIAAVYVVIWSVIICLFAGVLSLAVGGVGGIVGGIVLASDGLNALLLMSGAGLVCAGLAVAMFLAVKELSVQLVHLTALFMRWVKSWFLKKERA